MDPFFEKWQYSHLYNFHDIVDTWVDKFPVTESQPVFCSLHRMLDESKYTSPTLYLLDAGLASYYWESEFWGHILKVSHDVVLEEGWEQQDLLIHIFHLIEDIQNHYPNVLPDVVFDMDMLRCCVYTHQEYVSPSLCKLLFEDFRFIWLKINYDD
jgi:hypothetical protein